jgi:uncharacterized membrane protein YgdD (TMEM256/DUF423 family)
MRFDGGSIDPPGAGCGALLAGLGVVLGAFGAHALKASLSAEALGWWGTAVQYQMWHALGLILTGALPQPRLGLPAAFLGGGTLLFSASLYAMALSGERWLGAVTPLGGAAMIVGWVLLAWRLRAPQRTSLKSSPAFAGEGDHAKHGGGVPSRAEKNPSTALRAVPLPAKSRGGIRVIPGRSG